MVVSAPAGAPIVATEMTTIKPTITLAIPPQTETHPRSDMPRKRRGGEHANTQKMPIQTCD